MSVFDIITRRQTDNAKAKREAEIAEREEYRNLVRRCVVRQAGTVDENERLADLATRFGRDAAIIQFDAKCLSEFDHYEVKKQKALAIKPERRGHKLRIEIEEKAAAWEAERKRLLAAIQLADADANDGAWRGVQVGMVDRNPWLLGELAETHENNVRAAARVIAEGRQSKFAYDSEGIDDPTALIPKDWQP